MDYSAIRDQINNGDVVLVKYRRGFWRLVRWVIGEHTHSGLAVWLDNGLYISEMSPCGNHVIPLSQIFDVEFDVFNCPVAVDSSAVRKVVAGSLRRHSGYSFVNLFLAGVNELFGFGFKRDGSRKICSEQTADELIALGWEYSGVTLPTPKSLVQKLGKAKFKNVRVGG